MRKLILLVVAVLTVATIVTGMSVAGVETPVTPDVEQADAHPGVVNPWDWCYYIDAAYGWDGQCVNARMIHYGDAHVYQGHIRNGSTGKNTCIQQVENYGWKQLVAWINYGWGDGTPCW
jgi:hypothetical protein